MPSIVKSRREGKGETPGLMIPSHHASCSAAAAAAIPAPGQQRHVAAGWHHALAALIPGPTFLRSALNQTDTAVKAVADIEPDAHTEIPVVRPFLDASDTISARKVADTSDWQPISVAAAAAADDAAASASGQAEPVQIGPDISAAAEAAETAVEAEVVEVVEAAVVGEQVGPVESAVAAQGAVDEVAYSAGDEQQLEIERFVEG